MIITTIPPRHVVAARHAVDLGHAVGALAPTICTTPGSFGERARSRPARAGSCSFLAHVCNMRQDYWLYAGYHCATPNPRLARVQDPFGNLLAKAKGSVLVSHAQVAEAEVAT